MASARKAASSRALLLGGFGGGVRDLSGCIFDGANLVGANLSGQMLTGTSFRGADLSGADLTHAHLVQTDLRGATLSGCRVYGISIWDVNLQDAVQHDLTITPDSEPTITCDNLEVAQFLYLLLNNEKIRRILDTLTSRMVLILGRFTPDRLTVLQALRDALRRKGFLPVLFDFDKPESRTITETVSTLAHLSSFVVADLTDAKSIPQELQTIVPGMPSVPVQPLLHSRDREYGMFEHFTRYPWVLKTVAYTDIAELIVNLDAVVLQCTTKANELRRKGP